MSFKLFNNLTNSSTFKDCIFLLKFSSFNFEKELNIFVITDIDSRLSSSKFLILDKSIVLNVSIKYLKQSTENGLNVFSFKFIFDKAFIESAIFFIFLLFRFTSFNTSKLDKLETILSKLAK